MTIYLERDDRCCTVLLAVHLALPCLLQEKGDFTRFLAVTSQASVFVFPYLKEAALHQRLHHMAAWNLCFITGRQRLVAARWLTSWSLCNREKRHSLFFGGWISALLAVKVNWLCTHKYTSGPSLWTNQPESTSHEQLKCDISLVVIYTVNRNYIYSR